MSIATHTQSDDESRVRNVDGVSVKPPTVLNKAGGLLKAADEEAVRRSSSERIVERSPHTASSVAAPSKVCSCRDSEQCTESVCQMCINLTAARIKKAKRYLQLDVRAHSVCRYCRRVFRSTEHLEKHIKNHHYSISSGE